LATVRHGRDRLGHAAVFSLDGEEVYGTLAARKIVAQDARGGKARNKTGSDKKGNRSEPEKKVQRAHEAAAF